MILRMAGAVERSHGCTRNREDLPIYDSMLPIIRLILIDLNVGRDRSQVRTATNVVKMPVSDQCFGDGCVLRFQLRRQYGAPG